MAHYKPETISTHNNPLIKQIMRLHDARWRTEQQQFIAEGTRTITTLLEAGTELATLVITPDQSSTATNMIFTNMVSQTKIVLVSTSVMAKISSSKTPSGIVAVFHIPPAPSATNLGSGIVLAALQDPGNVGTLIRTAAAMNKKTVVLVESVDPWSPKVVQASAGTLGLVTLFVLSFQQLVQYKKNIPLCALVAQGGMSATSDALKDALLVIGNEAHGIPEQWLAQCERTVTLAMPGNVESLNAAVAGSIALYLATLQ